MILPVAKLGTLALKTICKPIARRIKKEATFHPQFRLFITNIAQANHRLTTTIQRQIYGHATDVAIRPLNEEKAVQAAADLLGELFVFARVIDFSTPWFDLLSICSVCQKLGATAAAAPPLPPPLVMDVVSCDSTISMNHVKECNL
ncbi:putative OPA3-like protein CG13603 [Coffea eugenioides]|uniref:putative OPA3-like protein CG13603 n=1 Tax=Coffea eugenioides TaxID=49369 RepID=UPI000F606B14|nr:putative OPA3-like protein CG13603 [Coffea eugenioides]